jgi:hypothetical protein
LNAPLCCRRCIVIVSCFLIASRTGYPLKAGQFGVGQVR